MRGELISEALSRQHHERRRREEEAARLILDSHRIVRDIGEHRPDSEILANLVAMGKLILQPETDSASPNTGQDEL